MLKRMDPAEIGRWLATQGQGYVAERPGMSKLELIEAEKRVVLAAGHKARNAIGPKYFTQIELRESRQWLKDHGFRTGITKHRG